ncbi:hypothetical protein TrVFT333_009808 [Trichoderma virens FT-333]|nr:hypothetical protein TrVFT333_009808 [Trichoderma virens FT-333]
MIPEARHTFPLYDGAVVTSFECRVGDARRLQGVVKPTAQAKREFEESKAKREAAALLEELAPEVFETSLGNIPPNTKVEIILTYVHELKVVTSQEEKAEGLALTIPTSIAPQYVTPLPELPKDKLEITIRVLDDGTIDAAACHVESNHAVKYEGSQPLIANIGELGNINLPAGGAQKMQHVWQYSSNAQLVLGSDFVLVIQMRQETRLHSRAVIAPANEYGHAALMVSLRPNDIFGSAVNPQLFKGEILFILDQSGSMGWTQSARDQRLKIDTMKNAMSLALSGLPSTCRFNIISFGSEVRGMWLRSRGADEPANLSYAMEYLDTVGANMGGTEILLALKGAVNNCEPSLPSTQIILITDGEVHHEPHDAIMEFVWETRQKFGEKIRFFTLGIGDRVSHRVVEGIAELGGGYCDVVDVVKKPRWEDRVNRMLRSVMEPDSWTCEIDLGPGFERRSLAACQFGADNRPDSHLALYVQGPYPIPSLSPYRYKSFFFLLDMGSAELPTTLTIRTTTDAAKKKVYDMDVKPAQLRAGTIHPLAVKMALLSLENEVKGIDASKEQARINAEMLGTRYSISSKWTSFVAVADESRDLAHPIEVYKSVFKEANKQIFFGSERGESIWKAIPGFPLMGDRPGKLNGSSIPSVLQIVAKAELKSPSQSQVDVDNILEANKRSDKDGNLLFGNNGGSTENGGYPSMYAAASIDEASMSEKSPFRRLKIDNPKCVIPKAAENVHTDEVTAADTLAVTDANIRVPESCGPWAFEETMSSQPLSPIFAATNNAPEESSPFINLGPVDFNARADLSWREADVPWQGKEATSYEPSRDGPITWEDVVGCEKNGMFVLPNVVRERLGQHFCGKTVERLQETLRNLSDAAKVAKQDVAVLTDTLMMIQYCKTHLATQEDYWSLVIGKAERAVLLALGYDQDREEALEPWNSELEFSRLQEYMVA